MRTIKCILLFVICSINSSFWYLYPTEESNKNLEEKLLLHWEKWNEFKINVEKFISKSSQNTNLWIYEKIVLFDSIEHKIYSFSQKKWFIDHNKNFINRDFIPEDKKYLYDAIKYLYGETIFEKNMLWWVTSYSLQVSCWTGTYEKEIYSIPRKNAQAVFEKLSLNNLHIENYEDNCIRENK